MCNYSKERVLNGCSRITGHLNIPSIENKTKVNSSFVMIPSRGTFISLLILCLAENVHLNVQEDLMNAFGCLGSVIQYYKEFPTSSWSCDYDAKELGQFCKEDEITCNMESKNCKRWQNQQTTQVVIFFRFPTSILLEHLKMLNNKCRCKEYLFHCSIKSETLIQYIVHNITHLTSTVATSSPKTTSETTLPVTTALLTSSPATDPATTDSNHEEPSPAAAAFTEKNQGTSSIAIIAALFGGVILGAGVEFVVILLLRRKTKSTKECQRDGIEKSMDNPAYTDSKDCSKAEVTPEEYYTQITNKNSVYQNEIPDKDATYDHDQYKSTQETYEESTYNHLHERMEIESSNYYHHPRMVPNELSATELGYGMVKQSQINQEHTYTEVIAGEGEHHGYKGEDENRIYSVLEDKNL